MSTAVEREFFLHARDRNVTLEEFNALMAEYKKAEDRDDEAEMDRVIRLLPMNADVMMAFASVYGKEFMLECGFDMTEANIKYGEGWLDELKS